jgi:hypothetical protein
VMSAAYISDYEDPDFLNDVDLFNVDVTFFDNTNGDANTRSSLLPLPTEPVLPLPAVSRARSRSTYNLGLDGKKSLRGSN